MTNSHDEEAINQVRDRMDRITSAWRRGQTEKLAELFHPRMTIVALDLTVLGEGREACIESYRAFTAAAVIREFSVSELQVRLWGATALVSYRYEMAWEGAGKHHREPGRDLFLFTREGGEWLAVWRKLVPVGAS